MRKLKMFLIGFCVLVLFVPAGFAQQSVAKSRDLFIGGNLGFGYGTGAGDDTDVNTSGFLYGVTGKFFFDKFGIGGTYNVSSYDNDDSTSVNIESEVSTTTLDIMYDFSKKENQRFYVAGCIGSFTEEVSGDFNAEVSTSLYGIGIGGYSKTGDFSFGADLRYVTLSESDNADGIIEGYVTLGFSFTDF